jgi:hypothetical protein
MKLNEMGIQARTKVTPSTGQLSKKQVDALASLVSGTLDSMGGVSWDAEGDDIKAYKFWVDLLYTMGAKEDADEWVTSLATDGIHL